MRTDFVRRKISTKQQILDIQPQNVITKDNGIETLSTGEKKNHYYDRLEYAFTFALLTGRRRHELVNVKFKDIVEFNGKPVYIEFEDFKYNRKNNLTKREEKKFLYTPVFGELMDFFK